MSQRNALLVQLQQIQKEEGYLPKERLIELSKKTKIPMITIYEIASFYSFFRLKKTGQHIIRVCHSPSCFMKGSHNLLEAIKTLLGILPGETTSDRKFSLELTSCIGCCDQPPAMMIDDTLHTDVTIEKLKEIFDQCK
ncbi:MAG: NAD(P)H-dependent oxidoreductase subunit E [Parachlamydiales bacterium]|nr:NAD(P)H-dependent oxidoreductase subunit E [Parachlamydiales bacterium]